MLNASSAGAPRRPWKARAYDLLRIILGVLLLTAAALKGFAIATRPVIQTGLLTSRPFLIILVESEFLLGAILLFGIFRAASRIVAILMFVSFACVTGYRVWRGDASCSCFGTAMIDPRYTLVLDLAAVIALLVFGPCPSELESPHKHTNRRAAFALPIIAIGLSAGLIMARRAPTSQINGIDPIGSSSIVLLEPEKWVGQRFPLAPYIDAGDQISTGRWKVILYHHDCPACRASISHYEAMVRADDARLNEARIAFVAMPPYAPPGEALFMASPRCIAARLTNQREWFVQAPVVMDVVDGMVIGSSDGK